MVTGKWDGRGDRPRGASKSHPGDDESIPGYDAAVTSHMGPQKVYCQDECLHIKCLLCC